MNTMQVDMDTLLQYRRGNNLPLYMNDLGDYGEFFIQASAGIMFRAKGDKIDPIVQAVLPFVNKTIRLFDERRLSHDFGNDASWPTVDDSACYATPAEGKVMHVTYIQVRFPKNIKILPTNKLCFQVNLWIDAYNAVVPVMDLQYESVLDIVRKSNTPVSVPFDIVDDLSTQKMIEIQFTYCNPDTLQGSPILLRHSKGENIKMWLSGNTPLLDINGTALADETWCVINGKETYEF